MEDLLRDTLLLNTYWQASNTPEMAARGVIIRDDIPSWIRGRSTALTSVMGLDAHDLYVQGRDGTGLKTEIPWVRVCSYERSPSATAGWYIVYLFAAQGDRVYLSLNQGTTIWNGIDYVPRPREQLLAQAHWARELLSTTHVLRPDLRQRIVLDARRSNLGRGYESGNVYALEYALDAIPTSRTLEADLLYMSQLLRVVYDAYDAAGYVPGNPSPEVFDAVTSAERAAGISRGYSGQGFGLTKEQQTAVERHALVMARALLSDKGWRSHYVGATKTWDIEAEQDGRTVFVEVKGTTSPGESVVLTGSQVREYGKKYPETMLIVVSNILLDRTVAPPVASGGLANCIYPWKIEEQDLEAISWKYSTNIGRRSARRDPDKAGQPGHLDRNYPGSDYVVLHHKGLPAPAERERLP